MFKMTEPGEEPEVVITSLSILMKSSAPWYLYQYTDAVGLVRALRSSVVGFGKPALPPIFVAYARNPSVSTLVIIFWVIFVQLTLKQEVKEMWQRLQWRHRMYCMCRRVEPRDRQADGQTPQSSVTIVCISMANQKRKIISQSAVGPKQHHTACIMEMFCS